MSCSSSSISPHCFPRYHVQTTKQNAFHIVYTTSTYSCLKLNPFTGGGAEKQETGAR